ncbi:MAG: hypothetical protein NT066_05895 [Candidatus Omnitrophica bacterium]|nr:hypothetical protein [Candidatus Omnitrophota bacterium]
MRNKSRAAQSILEYTLIISIVAVALFAMQLYFRRGIQAVVKLAADDIGNQQEGGDEIDPLRGIKQAKNAEIRCYISGASAGNPNLAAGATQRVRALEGGGRRVDLDRVTSSEGTTNYQTDYSYAGEGAP